MEDTPAAPMGWQPELDELKRREALAEQLGGADRVRRQHAGGRLTIRERIEKLVDPGTFHEIGKIAGTATYDAANDLTSFTPSNFVFGRAQLDGRPVVVGGDDFTVRGGSADATIKAKHLLCEQMANELRLPLLRLVEGSGGGGSVKTIETTGRANVPGVAGWASGWLAPPTATADAIARATPGPRAGGARCRWRAASKPLIAPSSTPRRTPAPAWPRSRPVWASCARRSVLPKRSGSRRSSIPVTRGHCSANSRISRRPGGNPVPRPTPCVRESADRVSVGAPAGRPRPAAADRRLRTVRLDEARGPRYGYVSRVTV